jgi:homoserine kinase type II
VISFLEGMWLRKPDARHCREVGKALAPCMWPARGLRSAARMRCRSAAGGRSGTIRATAPTRYRPACRARSPELDFLEAHWPKDLPEGVIHADLFPDNVFFLGDELSGLIDFYFACNDLLAYDVSICLNAWCFEKDGAFNITKGMALLSGYQSVRPLTPPRSSALPLLARGSALRFFLTRLYDWLMTPAGALVVKKDPLEYLKKLQFHRSIKTAAEYGLTDETMPA